ncbi:MAG: hypothetical protein DME59_20235, partial [Verrucomicrobia bacterium]
MNFGVSLMALGNNAPHRKNLLTIIINSDTKGQRRRIGRIVMKVSRILPFILILSGYCAPRCGATVHDSDGTQANVQALLHAAHDGDTIMIPAGTFSWTSRVDITKGITLKGQTTITGAGTANPTVNSLTIIQDNSPRSTKSSGVIRMTLTPGQSGRITGLTITHGTSTVFNQNGVVQLVS